MESVIEKKMKRNIFYTIILGIAVSTLSVFGQVGVNTTKGIEIFNVDALGNNPVTNPQSASTLNDDVIFRLNNNNNNANLVIGGSSLSPKGSASLELNATDKALLLNRVALKSAQDDETVADPIEGMMVYNTAIAGETPYEVTPGLYIFQSNLWTRMRDVADTGASNVATIRDMATSTGSSNAGYNAGILTDPVTGQGSAAINFYNSNIGTDTSAPDHVVIPESGRYIFSFKLYGRPLNTAGNVPGRRRFTYGEYGIYLYKVEAGGAETLISKSFMTIMDIGNSFFTYTPTLLTPMLNTGDQIRIKAGYVLRPDNYVWRLVGASPTNRGKVANRTSLAFWKLQ